MTTLGALSQAWVSAEASLPLGWQLTGLMRFGGNWVGFSEGPGEADYLSGSGQHTTQGRSLTADLVASLVPCA